LSSSKENAILLDMCFKPRRTRFVKLAEKYDWTTVEGTAIIGHQVEEQYRLWLSEKGTRHIDTKGAWAVLQEAAETSISINF
jgi:quinate dehydrogenase